MSKICTLFQLLKFLISNRKFYCAAACRSLIADLRISVEQDTHDSMVDYQSEYYNTDYQEIYEFSDYTEPYHDPMADYAACGCPSGIERQIYHLVLLVLVFVLPLIVIIFCYAQVYKGRFIS